MNFLKGLFSFGGTAKAVSPRKLFMRSHRAGRGSRWLDAAKTDNLTAGWSSTNFSGNAILKNELDIVRARSRYLADNDPYFNRFLGLCEENVIGPAGISLHMRITDGVRQDGTTKLDERAARIIEDAWYRWSKRASCTLNKRDSLLGVLQIALRSVARDGEIFIRKVRGAKNPFGFALQLIEADYVESRYNAELSGGAYIRLGIEYNADDVVVAYHVLKRHPGEYGNFTTGDQQRIRVPASDMVHLFVRERASQSRGLPWGVSSMTRSKMLQGYEDAELVAARVGASKMGFFVTPSGDEYQGDGTGIDAQGNEAMITNADPGVFEQIPHGFDFKTFDPQHPTGAFESFTKRILRGIASGFGVGYNNLTNDYEGVSYSSLRQSHLTERDYWRKLQSWIIDAFLDEVFADWLLMAFTTNQVEGLPITKFDKFNSPTWRPRGWTWVDPLKEIAAHKMAIELGLDSASNIVAQMGRDLEEIYMDMKSEASLREKYGITLNPSSSTVVFPGDAPNVAN